MSRLQGRPEVITNYVEAVGFSFYTDAEKHAISVKQISSPVLFDNLKNPVVGGLYDPALGPLNQTSTCTTCRQPQLHCTGHFGHIDLILPVYNPLVFKELVKILKWICPFCHHFKMHEQRVALFATKLELIAEGRMIDAARLQLPKSDDEEGVGMNLSDEDVETIANDILTTKSGNPRTQWTSTQLAAARTVISRFKDDMPKTKCENCLAHVPVIKQSGVGKIFQEPLSSSHRSNNIMRGIRNTVTLRSLRKKSNSDDEMEDVEESINAMDMELDTDAMESMGSAKKGKGCKVLNPKSSGFKAEDHESWSKKRFLTTSEVREHITLTWQTEKRICALVWGLGEIGGRMGLDKSAKSDASMFFLQTLLVTPNKFRPPNIMNGDVLEHPQNIFYGRIIRANIAVTEASRGKKGEDGSKLKVDVGQATRLWLALQNDVCALLDSTTATGLGKDQQGGVRQLLEKKEGLFRMNMMGKRVNYACRSVISPDPYIAVNEIGIPPYFATRLTYPERVTPWNVHQMREAVENGPQVHPGATHVEDEEGRIIGLDKLPKHKRTALAKTLLSTPGMAVRGTNVDGGRSVGKTVYRHLRDGDVLLVNRQPTLHKPGVMAHKARVLKGEKTLRLHYANCSTYNADFDGDEMNVHFPQEELGRAEAYEIVNADQQYVVPTSGDPIRGLIQDHIVSATLLTKRDTFLSKEDYHQLVYSACVSMNAANFKRKNKNVALSLIDRDLPIIPLPPAVMKPYPLWTGKQVLTTVFNHITHGFPSFTLKAPIKVSGDYWGKTSGELELIVRDNELVCGVIDKAQFGKFGIVHTFQELYGPEMAGRLLSVFSRLFTAYLQMHGFTCGFGDLLLVPKSEKSRRNKLKETDDLGNKINARFVGVDEEGELNMEEIRDEVEKRIQSKGDAASARLDMLMTSALNRITSDINNTIFPKGLMKPFPANCLSLMTITGAKGGLVNFTQISSLLGQQELEGKRVPRMSSGKTLPCFPPWDPSARAGGFIGDRFLTGLRPQEYYFHCMAGRDGLVDTAVKTSRSGYLQRCLMKNLESLKVHYDYTVRDSDGSIVQFRYGEDGIDVTKTSHLLKFELLATNQDLVSLRLGKDPNERPKRNKKDKVVENKADFEGMNNQAETLEAVSMAFEAKVDGFIANATISKAERKRLHLRSRKDRENFRYLMSLKYASSLAQPGEPVGCLAAQSVGEPSTQMTLNTFHFAGRGEMNVTLGIPRLREILMTASADISTPIMTCPLLIGKTREDAERLAMKLRKLRLIDLLENVEVGEVPFAVQNGQPSKIFKIRLKVYPPHRYPPHLDLESDEIEDVIRDQFIPRLVKEMKKYFQSRSGTRKENIIHVVQPSQLGEGSGAEAFDNGPDDGEEPKGRKKGKDVEAGEMQEDEDEEEGGEEEGADAEKRRGQDNDERGYDDDVDDDEMEIAEKTKEKDLKEQAVLGDEDDEQEVVENMDRDNLYDDEADRGDTDVVPRTPDVKKRDSASKIRSTSKSQGPQKEVDGADSLTINGNVFEMKFTVKLSTPHIILAEVVEKVASQVSVRAVAGIEKCAVIDYKGDSSNPALQTDGVNFEGIWTLSDDLDLNRLTTNNVASMLKVYGVEACRATILSEVQAVFGSYGISVNPRHLALIADFMTFQGGYRACNRLGINSSPSPFLKMSFETATVFLMDATLQKHSDYLESPSARIVMGRIVEMGTGSFDLLQNIDGMIAPQA
ncbi:DNA-directed RNA polymerase I subunit 1 [Physcomitrium patens]|uniref:DNA-directed RNA polymerase subunit n=1 Tax=Physcomitrium patens TaxID=3218 RepID=A0A2K1JG38_PHYPA|nr:DNA-directed RNA polymerase I subunit 1-like [Physcomitrium patens]PNR40510.1 hypothetical protein PHYPA_017912 [Physcomitrium patens]|eukprot:XP_024394449.1 DNA-directed RNA polymerase I subunit 1-like [Physcomitrella patens]